MLNLTYASAREVRFTAGENEFAVLASDMSLMRQVDPPGWPMTRVSDTFEEAVISATRKFAFTSCSGDSLGVMVANEGGGIIVTQPAGRMRPVLLLLRYYKDSGEIEQEIAL